MSRCLHVSAIEADRHLPGGHFSASVQARARTRDGAPRTALPEWNFDEQVDAVLHKPRYHGAGAGQLTDRQTTILGTVEALPGDAREYEKPSPNVGGG